MFLNYTKQIYHKLIAQDFNPFAANLYEDLTNNTMSLCLMKMTDDIIYVVNLLNAFKYKPEVLMGKSQLDRANFLLKFKSLNVKFINIFISENDEICKDYINKIDINTLQEFKDIYWSVSIDNNGSVRLYSNKYQPSKILGIEKIIVSFKKDDNSLTNENMTKLTAKAIIDAPLRAKRLSFQFYTLIIAINVLVFAYLISFGAITTQSLLQNGAFSYDRIINNGEYYRIFTSLFLHASFSHLFANMFTLLIFGKALEASTSHITFLATYFLSGICANLFMLISPSTAIMVGASGCIFGVIGATLVLSLFFNKRIYGLSFSNIFVIAIINLGYSLAVPEISFIVHLIGFIFGILFGFVYAIDESKKFKYK